MCPETRRLIEIEPENEKDTETMFNILLGDNLSERKKYIAENGENYIEQIDIS